jgi:hypothetical protein
MKDPTVVHADGTLSDRSVSVTLECDTGATENRTNRSGNNVPET